MTVEEALGIIEKVLDQGRLNKVQEIVFRQSWEGKSYIEIAKSSGYDTGYIKDAGSKLWQLLSNAFAQKVTKNNFQSVLKQYTQKTQVVATAPATLIDTAKFKVKEHNLETGGLRSVIKFRDVTAPFAAPPHQDWGEAIDVSVFYGRTAELIELEQWIVQERCRLIMILGMGGIGKTALCVKLAERVQEYFEFVIWRSLRNAPPIQEILKNLIEFLSNEQETNLPQSIDAKVSRLLHYLRSSRCLLILDNAESILRSGDYSGQYREGYEGYGQLLRCIRETRHQSCLVLTSREKPIGLASKESKALSIRGLQLTGLQEEEIRKLFETKGSFHASEDEWRVLANYYAGNPLVIQIAAAAIQNVFDSNISKFLAYLKQDISIFDGIHDLLDTEFNCLSDLEKEVLYWLAINQEEVPITELSKDILSLESKQKLINTLDSLKWRSLVAIKSANFSLQPVVMDYITTIFVEKVFEEIISEKLNLLISHALIKTQTKDCIKPNQIRTILKPIIFKLRTKFKSQKILEAKLNKLLIKIREEFNALPGYGYNNISKLIWQIKTDLKGS